MMSGTPVLASKLGGYCDTIINGKTGFLCQLEPNKNCGIDDYNGELDDWINILENKKYTNLNSDTIREYAVYKFNPDKAYGKYWDFLERVLTHHININ